IMKQGQPHIQINDILELDLDPANYSGIDYWCQEARSLRATVMLTTPLQFLLIGDMNLTKAGFHTFWAQLLDDQDNVIYTGVMAKGAFSIEYLSLGCQTVELEFMDFFGLILTLARDRFIPLTLSYINPIQMITSILDQVINPSQNEPDTQLYTNADVQELASALSLSNLTISSQYDTALWQPYEVDNYLLLDSQKLRLFTGDVVFGFNQQGQDIYLHFKQTSGLDYRYRKYRIHSYYNVELVESIDRSFLDSDMADLWITSLPNPHVSSSITVDQGYYYIKRGIAYYRGPASISAVDVVPGSYKADALLGELLTISNAVIVTYPNALVIKNRINPSLPLLLIADPLEANVDYADSSLPSLSAVAVASQNALDNIADHYKRVLADYPFQITLKTHLYSSDYANLALASPYELINHCITFHTYKVIPHSINLDPDTLEITIEGRAQYA
ncbi:MAG: hypothetical protein GX294_05645, partial [Candidatus Cloacimonetes bacterium]|nr:hypothetical protein [Candidatus Cloacimonadota bacterium]